MKQRRFASLFLGSLSILAISGSACIAPTESTPQAKGPADLVLKNGRVYADEPAEAVVVSKGVTTLQEH
jgi:hypothetical protein